jgi:hypothetical protein
VKVSVVSKTAVEVQESRDCFILSPNHSEPDLISPLSASNESLPLNDIPTPLPAKLSIKTKKLTFNLQDPQVQSLLTDTRQLFVGFEFLDFDSVDLESPSVPLTESGTVDINFEKGTLS